VLSALQIKLGYNQFKVRNTIFIKKVSINIEETRVLVGAVINSSSIKLRDSTFFQKITQNKLFLPFFYFIFLIEHSFWHSREDLPSYPLLVRTQSRDGLDIHGDNTRSLPVVQSRRYPFLFILCES